MIKFLSITLFSILVFNITANAEWTGAFNIGTIKNVSDGRIIFSNASNGDQYQYDGTTVFGKNMLASVLSAKAMGKTIKVNRSSLVASPNWWAITETEIQN